MAQNDNLEYVSLTFTGGKVERVINFPVSCTILYVKQVLQVMLNVKVERQTLQFEGQELQDENQLKDYAFQPSSQVSLIVEPYPGNEDFSVQVRNTGGCIGFVTVKETMSVEEFKMLVGTRFGLLPEVFSLTRLGVEMEGGSPLSAYYVCKYSDVTLTVKIAPR